MATIKFAGKLIILTVLAFACHAESVFYKLIKFETFTHGSVMDIKTDKHGNIVLGVQLLRVQDNNISEAIGLATLNIDGQVLSKKTLFLPDHNLRSIAVDGDNYILAGIYTTGEKSCWIKKIDKQGNILWTKKFGNQFDPNTQWWLKILKLRNGHYLLYGYLATLEKKKAYMIMEINSDGNIVWKDWSSTIGWIRDAYESKDGSYVVSAVLFTKQENSWRQYILRYNEQGKIISKLPVQMANYIITSIYELKNEKIGLVGEAEELDDNHIFKSYLLILDKDGSVELERYYLLDECIPTRGEVAFMLSQNEESMTILSTCGQERVIKRKLNKKGDIVDITHQKMEIGIIKSWTKDGSFIFGGTIKAQEKNTADQIPLVIKY